MCCIFYLSTMSIVIARKRRLKLKVRFRRVRSSNPNASVYEVRRPHRSLIEYPNAVLILARETHPMRSDRSAILTVHIAKLSGVKNLHHSDREPFPCGQICEWFEMLIGNLEVSGNLHPKNHYISLALQESSLSPVHDSLFVRIALKRTSRLKSFVPKFFVGNFRENPSRIFRGRTLYVDSTKGFVENSNEKSNRSVGSRERYKKFALQPPGQVETLS